MKAPKPILAVDAMSVCYGKVAAVSDVSLSLRAGSVVAVIGPNGAGKTTLVNAVLGLLPATGRVRFDGRPIDSMETEERVALGLGLAPERGALFGNFTVMENLLIGAYSRRHARDNSRADDLAEMFRRFPRLDERRGQQASTLSGGERQMLSMARALMARPRVLLLDEPSIGLAPLIVREVFSIVKDLSRSGTTILLVEQNARAALRIADYAFVMESGVFTLDGPASEIAQNDAVIKKYLGIV